MSDGTLDQGRPSGADDITVDRIEETLTFRPRFGADNLLAVAATDAVSGRLLMVAWMNEEALRLTLRTGEAHYWSRSRQTIWRKGETSGHVQRLVEIRTDCDQDAIEIVVEQLGVACHTGRTSCFYRRLIADENGVGLEFED